LSRGRRKRTKKQSDCSLTINLIANKMNSIGYKDTVQPQLSFGDAFNYPTLNRNMVMSMNTITTEQDHVKTNTQRFVS
jgi:hypothetical protein